MLVSPDQQMKTFIIVSVFRAQRSGGGFVVR
jgi:hypothetical protein